MAGMSGALARNTPSLTGTCGSDNHQCTDADVIPANTQGTVQKDPPVAEPAGWSWVKVIFDSGVNGWVSGYPPYVVQLTPPTMVSGSVFKVVGDYNGATVTTGNCIQDGVNSNATLSLQPSGTNTFTGTVQCPMPPQGLGNHIVVLRVNNANGSASSNEFQYAMVSEANPNSPPTKPTNLRIQ